MNSVITPWKTACTSTTCMPTILPPARPESRDPYLPPWGPRLPPDRCPRRGRPKNHGMSHGAGRARLQLTPPTALSPTQVMTEREILIKAVDRAVAQGWLGIRDEGYRYDGVVLHQGDGSGQRLPAGQQELAFQPPRPDAAFRRVRRSLFRQRPPPMDRSGPLRPMPGGIRVHRHRVLLAVPPGPTSPGASTPQISGRIPLTRGLEARRPPPPASAFAWRCAIHTWFTQ